MARTPRSWNTIALPAVAAAAVITLGLAGVHTAHPIVLAAADFPISIDNCGVSHTYSAPPERAIAMNQAATEILLSLGLQRRMIGSAYLDDGVSASLRSAYGQVPVLSEKYPAREVVVATRPDFIYAAYAGAFAPDAAGTRDELERVHVATYLSPAGCPVGLRPATASFDTTFAEIRDIGRIFGVSDRAEALIRSCADQLADVRRSVGTVPSPPRVFWYDSGSPPTAGACCGMPNEIMRLAGATNIFADTPGSWTKVSWESVVARNPEVIVLVDALWSPAAEKRRELLSDKVYAGLDAVRHQRFVTIRFGDSTPGIRNIAAVTALAKGLYPEKFKTP